MACYRERPLWDNTQLLNTIIKGGMLPQLHSEIKRFNKLIFPTTEEKQRRNSAISRFRHAAQLLWPSCKVIIYGSFATELYLPSSDIDLVVLNIGWLNTQVCLQALAAHLDDLNFAFYVKVLNKARVPIVKFEERESGLSFDVRVVDWHHCFTELQAVKMIKQWNSKDPVARPLYMVLKAFLQQEKLNEVFHSGGIASYMLFVMLKTYLKVSELGFAASAQAQTMKLVSTSQSIWINNPHGVSVYTLSSSHGAQAEDRSGRGQVPCTEPGSRPLFKHREGVIDLEGLSKLGIESYTYLGLLLIGFFHFYGICFNSELYGISCRDGGSFFKKEYKGFCNPLRPFLLAVEDPLTPSNDIGKNSFNYRGIQAAFLRAYEALTCTYPTSNLLYCIIPLAKKWKNRKQRQKGQVAAPAAVGLRKMDSTKVEENVQILETPTGHHINQPCTNDVAGVFKQIERTIDSILQGDYDRQLAFLKLLDDLHEKQEFSLPPNFLQTFIQSRGITDLTTLLSTKIQIPLLTLIQESPALQHHLKKYLKRVMRPVITVALPYSRGWVHPELGRLDAGC